MPHVRIGTRTRLERRSLRGDDRAAWRAREQVRAALSLGVGLVPQAVIWTEPFVALNRTAQVRQTVDRLRLFAGIALPLGRRVSLEVGYLRQRQYRTTRGLATDAVPLVVSMHF